MVRTVSCGPANRRRGTCVLTRMRQSTRWKPTDHVSFKGTKTITLTVEPGSYKFYRQPHESTMFRHSKVS